MALEVHNNDIVYITIISATTLNDRASLFSLRMPLYRSLFTFESVGESVMKTLLGKMTDIPQTFFNGHDCDMVQKLARMLRGSMIQRHRVDIDYFCVFVMVFKDSCCYNIVNCSCFFHGVEEEPSTEFVRGVACEGGVYSLPAGARAIKRLKAQEHDEEDNCAICLQGFPYGSEVARLPCSHVYHYGCVLEWFVKKGTCPLCRFPCSHA